MKVSNFNRIKQTCTLEISLDEYEKISQFRDNYDSVPAGNGRQYVKQLLDLVLDGPPPPPPVDPPIELPR